VLPTLEHHPSPHRTIVLVHTAQPYSTSTRPVPYGPLLSHADRQIGSEAAACGIMRSSSGARSALAETNCLPCAPLSSLLHAGVAPRYGGQAAGNKH
jgi:hypothetical protein